MPDTNTSVQPINITADMREWAELAIQLRPNKDGQNVLHLAVANGNIEQVQALLLVQREGDKDSLVEIESEENSGLLVQREGDKDSLAEIETEEDSGLLAWFFHLVVCCYPTRVDGKDNSKFIDGKDLFNRTPLFYAITKGKVDKGDIVKLLIENGADPNCLDCWKNTPLHYAAASRHLVIAQMLIDSQNFNPENINAQNEDGETPLHVAIRKNRLDMVKLLIEKGADLKNINTCGDTPLHVAVQNSWFYQFDIVNLLIEKGADVHLENKQGKTPLSMAQSWAKINENWNDWLKEYTLKEIWEMDSAEYDSYFQWPPAEVRDNILPLVTRGFFSGSGKGNESHLNSTENPIPPLSIYKQERRF